MNVANHAWLALAAVPALCFAQPISKEDQVRSTVDAYTRALFHGGSAGGGTAPQKRAELVDEMMSRLEPDSLSAEQLLTLSAAGVLREYSKRADVIVRLEKLAESRDAHGAAAALALVGVKPESGGPGPDAVANMAAALRHPGLARLAPSIAVKDAMSIVTNYLLNRESAVGLLLPELTAFFSLDLGLPIAPHLNVFLDLVERAKLTPSQIDPLREAMLGAVKRCRRKLDNKESMIDAAVAIGNSRTQVKSMDPQEFRPHLAAQLDNAERTLKGSFGGRVVGQPAPSVDLKWAQAGLGATDTAELKGRIRVLVMWWRYEPEAAYSGTALIRKLTERYADKPVDVIALTSFIDGPLYMGGKQIDPGGTREQQVAAAVATAKASGLTCPLAYVDQKRFIAAFGVRGGNDAVVIDGNGVVRGTELDGNAPDAIFRIIDGLLATSEPATKP